MTSTLLKKSQAGFILPAALWLLAGFTVAASFFALWVERAVDNAYHQTRQLEATLAVNNTQANILFNLMSQSINYAGLMTEMRDNEQQNLANLGMGAPRGTEIALDARPYKVPGGTIFSLQDIGGIPGLNFTNDTLLEKLLGNLGVPAQDRASLVARLHDYTDEDDFHRLNGAERSHYLDAGREPPANRPLKTSWETFNILGWDQHSGLWQNGNIADLTSIIGGNVINLNTSPKEVLQTVPGIDAEMAHKIISNRPHLSLTDASRAVGRPLALDPLGTAFLASQSYLLTLGHPALPYVRKVLLRLTPAAENSKPWMIEHELEISGIDWPSATPDPAPGALFAETDAASQ